MHTRLLTKNVSNISEYDIQLRNNIHEYEAIIYGYNQQKTLAFDLIMTFSTEFITELYMYLKSEQIRHSMDINNLISEKSKYTRFINSMSFNSTIGLTSKKNIGFQSNNTLTPIINTIINKPMKSDTICTSICIGTLNAGQFMYDLKDYFMSDIQNKTMNQLKRIKPNIFGLKIIMHKYLKLEQIFMNLDINNLISKKNKYTHFINSIDFESIIGLSAEKKTKFKNINTLTPIINTIINKPMKSDTICTSICIGTLSSGNKMNDLKNNLMTDMKNKTMNELKDKKLNIYGLKVGIIKRTKMNDLRHLYMSDLQNRTMSNIGRLIIY